MVAAGGAEVRSVPDLHRLLTGEVIGAGVSVVALRDGRTLELVVRPAGQARVA